MSKETEDLSLDLQYQPELAAVPRLIRLVLLCGVDDRADEIVFISIDANAEEGMRIIFVIDGAEKPLVPMHGSIFSGVVVVLCNHASVSYFAKGRVRGEVTTTRPASAWLLESDDLQKRIRLVRQKLNNAA